MRDAAGQLTDRLHLLSLSELNFQRFLLGGVNHIQDQPVGIFNIVGIELFHRRNIGQRYFFFVFPFDVDVDAGRCAAGGADFGKFFANGSGVFSGDVIENAVVQERRFIKVII